MHGNVWELCADAYDYSFYSRANVDPYNADVSGSYRVYRGGSLISDARNCRSAFRGRRNPDFRSLNLGFRVAFVPSP